MAPSVFGRAATEVKSGESGPNLDVYCDRQIIFINRSWKTSEGEKCLFIYDVSVVLCFRLPFQDPFCYFIWVHCEFVIVFGE